MPCEDRNTAVAPSRIFVEDQIHLAPDEMKIAGPDSQTQNVSVTRLLPALSPALCRAARGALDWTQEDLAKRSTISRTTVRDYESCRHVIHRRTASLITAAFEREGLVLTQLPEVGFGIWKFECDSPGSQAELLKALF